VNAPLFSDYASKHRFIRVPEGLQITIDEAGQFVFPEGTVVVKTFGFYTEGAALIRAWIDAMPVVDCTPQRAWISDRERKLE